LGGGERGRGRRGGRDAGTGGGIQGYAVNFDRRLILVVGKGGVGRSTVAAAIAGACAAQGRRTLLYETNANDRFGDYFDKPPVGPTPTQLANNLWAVNATAASALAEYGLMILRWKSVYEMVFE